MSSHHRNCDRRQQGHGHRPPTPRPPFTHDSSGGYQDNHHGTRSIHYNPPHRSPRRSDGVGSYHDGGNSWRRSHQGHGRRPSLAAAETAPSLPGPSYTRIDPASCFQVPPAKSTTANPPPPAQRYACLFSETERSLLLTEFQPRKNLPLPNKNTPYFHRYRSFNRCLAIHAILFAWGDLIRRHRDRQRHSLAFPRNLQSHSGHDLIRDIASVINGTLQTMCIKYATWSPAHRRVQVIDVRLCDAILTLWPASLENSKSLLQSIQTRLTKDMAGEPCQSIDGFAQVQPLLVRDPSKPPDNAGFVLDWTIANAPYRFLELSNRFPKVSAASAPEKPTVRLHSSALPAPDPTASPRRLVPSPVANSSNKQAVVVLSSSSSSSSSDSSSSDSDSDSDSSFETESGIQSAQLTPTSAAPTTTGHFDPLTEFNKILLLNALFFTWSSEHPHPIVVPSARSHAAFDQFAQTLVKYAVAGPDLVVVSLQLDSGASSFARHPLSDTAHALWRTAVWETPLKHWIKEYFASVMGESDGHKGLVQVGNMETRPLLVFEEVRVGHGLTAAAASASAKDGEWVVNWAAQPSAYVFKTTSVPHRSPERERVVSESPPQTASAGPPSRKRTAFEAYPSSSSSSSTSSSESGESSDGCESDNEPSPQVKRPRLESPALPSQTRPFAPPSRPAPPRPPTAVPPPPPPPAHLLPSVHLVKIKPDPDAPPRAPADPLALERLHMRRLAQINMMRFKLRNTHAWATDAWFREVQAHVEDELTHDMLLRYADVTQARFVGEDAGFGEDEAIRLVGKVVVYEMVSERGYSPSTFMYVEELVEVGKEMGMGRLTREVVQELVGMMGDVE